MQIRFFLAVIIFGAASVASTQLALAQSAGQSGNPIVEKLSARLTALDVNKNGQIEAEEADDTAKMILGRYLPAPLQFPIAIADVVKAAEAKYANGGSSAPSASTPAASAPAASAPAGTPTAPPSTPPASTSPSQPSTTPAATTPSAGSASPAAPSTSPAPSASPSMPGTRGPGPSASSTTQKPRTKWSTAAERVPKGLPSWFLSKMDADGQITMANYTNNWTPEAVKQFEKYDLNHDGIITAAEVLKVEKSRGGR
jgi:hypothetical protein